MSDQDKISPYNINTISSRQEMELEENNNFIQYQILQTSIIRIVWQTVRRIAYVILQLKELSYMRGISYSTTWLCFFDMLL